MLEKKSMPTAAAAVKETGGWLGGLGGLGPAHYLTGPAHYLTGPCHYLTGPAHSSADSAPRCSALCLDHELRARGQEEVLNSGQKSQKPQHSKSFTGYTGTVPIL
ncbi:unnamed protein product [Lampetra fluviatilis]